MILPALGAALGPIVSQIATSVLTSVVSQAAGQILQTALSGFQRLASQFSGTFQAAFAGPAFRSTVSIAGRGTFPGLGMIPGGRVSGRVSIRTPFGQISGQFDFRTVLGNLLTPTGPFMGAIQRLLPGLGPLLNNIQNILRRIFPGFSGIQLPRLPFPARIHVCGQFGTAGPTGHPTVTARPAGPPPTATAAPSTGGVGRSDALSQLSGNLFREMGDIQNEMKNLSKIKDPAKRMQKMMELQMRMQQIQQMITMISEIRKSMHDMAMQVLRSMR